MINRPQDLSGILHLFWDPDFALEASDEPTAGTDDFDTAVHEYSEAKIALQRPDSLQSTDSKQQYLHFLSPTLF